MGQCLVFQSSSPACKPDRAAMLGSLRTEIGAIEALRSVRHGMAPLRFGDVMLDSALPWGGLPQAALHEISGTAAAVGFAAALAGRLAGSKPILWCRGASHETGGVHGPGLIPFGVDPEQVVFVETRKKQDLLWVMEESLRSGQPALVIGEIDAVSLVASRRLQLAAEAGGVTAFLLKTAVTKRLCDIAAGTSASSVALSAAWAALGSTAGGIRTDSISDVDGRSTLPACPSRHPKGSAASWSVAVRLALMAASSGGQLLGQASSESGEPAA